MYSRVILIALASAVIIIALLPYFAYRLSNSNTALKVRDWLSAYSGLIAVFIAIVASFPVFGQLEEMRVASSSATIQLIAGAQQALDSERGRVQELQSIAMRSIFSIAHPPTDLTPSLVEWNIKLENLIDEFKRHAATYYGGSPGRY